MKVLAERLAAEVDDGHVHVRKYVFDLGLANVAGIRLNLHNRTDQPIQVRLVEEFPAGFSLARVKVHPEYTPERWSRSEQEPRMAYEGTLPPGESVDTVYGIRVEDELDPYLGEPQVSVTRPDEPVESVDDRAPPGGDRPPASTPPAGDGFAFGEDRVDRD